MVRPIDALIEFLGAGHGRLLDIGCGAGTLGEELLQRGYDVIGIDPFRSVGYGSTSPWPARRQSRFKNESFDIALFTGLYIISRNNVWLMRCWKHGACLKKWGRSW